MLSSRRCFDKIWNRFEKSFIEHTIWLTWKERIFTRYKANEEFRWYHSSSQESHCNIQNSEESWRHFYSQRRTASRFWSSFISLLERWWFSIVVASEWNNRHEKVVVYQSNLLSSDLSCSCSIEIQQWDCRCRFQFCIQMRFDRRCCI